MGRDVGSSDGPDQNRPSVEIKGGEMNKWQM